MRACVHTCVHTSLEPDFSGADSGDELALVAILQASTAAKRRMRGASMKWLRRTMAVERTTERLQTQADATDRRPSELEAKVAAGAAGVPAWSGTYRPQVRAAFRTPRGALGA